MTRRCIVPLCPFVVLASLLVASSLAVAQQGKAKKSASQPSAKKDQAGTQKPQPKPTPKPTDKPVAKPVNKPKTLPPAKKNETATQKPKPAPAKKKAAKPEATSPATKSPKRDAKKAREVFDGALEDWKTIIRKMRILQNEYHTAVPEKVAGIQKEWGGLTQQAEQILPHVRDAALELYLAEPNKDRAVTRFLVKMAQDAAQHNQYEVAAKLANALIDHGCDLNEIYAVAVDANFATYQFDRAAELVKKGQEIGVMSGDVEDLRKQITEYQGLWKKEQELRKKETEADNLPRVKLTTSKGYVTVELFENEAPDTVGNFISLVKSGFYDGLTFHRVIPGFMAQGGCPEGDGSGGPGYRIHDECKKPNARVHFRGSLSMAKTNAPNSGGSQFFITYRPTSKLNGLHTVFGRVIEGMDAIDRLQPRSPDPTKSEELPEPDKIIKAEVLRDRGHEYLPHKVE